MSAFLYYIPGGSSALRRDDIAAAGLGYALDASYDLRECTRGPDGLGGAIISAGAEAVGYYPDRQTWQPMPGRATWLGWPTAAPPTPDDLARPSQFDGHWVELGDGRRWLVPVVRAMCDDPLVYDIKLPRSLECDASGRWQAGAVTSRHAELWSVVSRYWDARFNAPVSDSGISFEFDADELITGSVLGLAVNYRVSAAEVSACGLYDTDSPRRVLEAMVDWPSWEARLKNLHRLAASRLSGGPQVATKDTDLASSI